MRIGRPRDPGAALAVLAGPGAAAAGVLVKAGALAPERLMNAGRSALANLNGFVVLATLFLAVAQSFNLVTPEYGLPHLLF